MTTRIVWAGAVITQGTASRIDSVHPGDAAGFVAAYGPGDAGAVHLWPEQRLPGDHDRHKPIALVVVDHLDLCRMCVFRRPTPPGLAIMATAAHHALARTDTVESFTVPMHRRDLEFSTMFALDRAERLWPKRLAPGGRDDLMPIAGAVVDQLERAGWPVFMAAPDPPRSPPVAAAAAGRSPSPFRTARPAPSGNRQPEAGRPRQHKENSSHTRWASARQLSKRSSDRIAATRETGPSFRKVRLT